jgi:hypothetical protein
MYLVFRVFQFCGYPTIQYDLRETEGTAKTEVNGGATERTARPTTASAYRSR